MKVYIAIAIFGILGCWARYGMTNLIQAIYGRGFPYATLSINVLGSFLMGFLFIETLERCWHRAKDNADGREPAENAGLLLSLLRAPENGKKSDIYGYWYALRDFWNGFQDHRHDRPVYTI